MCSQLLPVRARPRLLVAWLHQERHQSLDLQDRFKQVFFLAPSQVANRPIRDDAGAVKLSSVSRVIQVEVLRLPDTDGSLYETVQPESVTNYLNRQCSARPRGFLGTLTGYGAQKTVRAGLIARHDIPGCVA